MAAFASSYIPTGAVTATRNKDQTSFVYGAQPQAMTIYLRFIEAGAAINPALSALISVGTFGAPPSFRIVIYGTGSTSYQLAVGSSALQVTSTVAAGTIGQLTELLATITSTGVSQLSSRINAGAVTVAAASGAVTLPQAFPVSTLWLGTDNNAIPTFTDYMNVLIARGVQTLGTMARLAMAA
jgi:hypothetical protein